MKIIIAGGTGQVGRFLASAFQHLEHEVVILSRSPRSDPWKTVIWSNDSTDAWGEEIDGADVVINLAGRSVNCRYNPKNRRQIIESRTKTTTAIGQAIQNAAKPPKLWLNAGTATIYSHRYDAPNDEFTGVLGDDGNFPDSWRFSIDVAEQWEAAVNQFKLSSTRTVIARMAMVMGSGKKSVFDVLVGLAGKGLGGTLGNGKQYMSWIHELDFLRAVQWLIERENLSGPVNFCSPQPMPNKEFMKVVRDTVRAPIGLPAANWMLEIGAFFLRTETELMLKSRRVIPGKLEKDGFKFLYPHWTDAAQEISERHARNIGFQPEMLESSAS